MQRNRLILPTETLTVTVIFPLDGVIYMDKQIQCFNTILEPIINYILDSGHNVLRLIKVGH